MSAIWGRTPILEPHLPITPIVIRSVLILTLLLALVIRSVLTLTLALVSSILEICKVPSTVNISLQNCK